MAPTRSASSPLAKALGVTKGDLFWHFAVDRQPLPGETLDVWERVGVDVVIERVKA